MALTAATMDNEGFARLCTAVTGKAVADYINVVYCNRRVLEPDDRMDHRNKEVTRKSLIDFFTSGYGETITGIDGKAMMRALRRADIRVVDDKDKFQKLMPTYITGLGLSRVRLRKAIGLSEKAFNKLLAYGAEITQEQFEILKPIFVRAMEAAIL